MKTCVYCFQVLDDGVLDCPKCHKSKFGLPTLTDSALPDIFDDSFSLDNFTESPGKKYMADSFRLFDMPSQDILDEEDDRTLEKTVKNRKLIRFWVGEQTDNAEADDRSFLDAVLKACRKQLRKHKDLGIVYQLYAECYKRLGNTDRERGVLIDGIKMATVKSCMLVSLGFNYLLTEHDDLCILCFCLAVWARRHMWPGPDTKAIMFVREILSVTIHPKYHQIGEVIIRQFEGDKAGWYLAIKRDIQADVRARAQRSKERFASEIKLAKEAIDWLDEYFKNKTTSLQSLAPKGVHCSLCNIRLSLEECIAPRIVEEGGSKGILFDCPKCGTRRAYNPDTDFGF